jgi:hypothetical protein
MQRDAKKRRVFSAGGKEREQLADRLALKITAREQLAQAQKSEVEAREILSRQNFVR